MVELSILWLDLGICIHTADSYIYVRLKNLYAICDFKIDPR